MTLLDVIYTATDAYIYIFTHRKWLTFDMKVGWF